MVGIGRKSIPEAVVVDDPARDRWVCHIALSFPAQLCGFLIFGMKKAKDNASAFEYHIYDLFFTLYQMSEFTLFAFAAAFTVFIGFGAAVLF